MKSQKKLNAIISQCKNIDLQSAVWFLLANGKKSNRNSLNFAVYGNHVQSKKSVQFGIVLSLKLIQICRRSLILGLPYIPNNILCIEALSLYTNKNFGLMNVCMLLYWLPLIYIYIYIYIYILFSRPTLCVDIYIYIYIPVKYLSKLQYYFPIIELIYLLFILKETLIRF